MEGYSDAYNWAMHEALALGMTDEQADYWAKWQVIQEFGTSALYDLSIGLAYGLGRSDNSVKRSLFRK
ncbi:MAG: hypothetical protein IJA67_07805 [Oscillospiraceae bacterium]|nr:hypothetical protein [Oscillospiraceae bacterium]